MNGLTSQDIKAVFTLLSSTMTANRDRLTELDSIIGDGDLGITMCRGFGEASKTLAEIDDTDPGKLLMKAGMVFAKTAPSTMGTLVATGIMRGGKAVAGSMTLFLDDIALFFDAFTNGIMERGKAKPGEKTILDALVPAVEALKRADAEGRHLTQGLADAYEAAMEGAERAKAMHAVHGRPAYYGDESIGKEDPGAFVGVLLIGAFVEYVGQSK